MEVSTNRLISREQLATPEFPVRKLESLGDHGILLARNIRAARASEIENTV